jgi:hypothetical protein
VGENHTKFITNWDLRNFVLVEDGIKITNIGFSNPLDRGTLTVGFVVNLSKDLYDYRDDIKSIAFKIIDSFKGGKQGGLILGFRDRVWLLHGATPFKTTLRDVFENLQFSGVHSDDALYKALAQAIYDMRKIHTKKYVLLLTSHKLGQSQYEKQAKAIAKNLHTPIFVVNFSRFPESENLTNLAKETGGRYFFFNKDPKLKEELGKTILSCIENQCQYLFQYKSKAEKWGGHWSKILVQAGQGRLYTLERVGYFVPEEFVPEHARGVPAEAAHGGHGGGGHGGGGH